MVTFQRVVIVPLNGKEYTGFSYKKDKVQQIIIWITRNLTLSDLIKIKQYTKNIHLTLCAIMLPY